MTASIPCMVGMRFLLPSWLHLVLQSIIVLSSFPCKAITTARYSVIVSETIKLWLVHERTGTRKNLLRVVIVQHQHDCKLVQLTIHEVMSCC